MLTAIRVGNFKAFAESQRIPLRPLTLIFGANSSGKSTILHSLILSRHAQETGDLDVYHTKVGGDSVDLGGFRQFIHRRDEALKLQLEWEISNQSFSKRLTELLPRAKNVSIGITIGFSGLHEDLIESAGDLTPRQVVAVMIEQARENNDQIKVDKLEGILATAEDKLTFEELGRLERRLRIERCSLDVDGNRFISTSVRPAGHLQLDVFYVDNEAARFIVENLIMACSTSDHVDTSEIESLASTVDELVPNISFRVERLFPVGLLTTDQLPSSVLGMSLVTVRKEFRMEDLKKVIKIGLPSILEEIITGVSGIVTEELFRVSYLGPLRTYPPRHIGFTQQQDTNWEAGGGVAWDIAKRDSAIRRKINEWLGDEKKLSTAYEFKIRYLLTIESIRGKLEELASRAISTSDYVDGDEQLVDRTVIEEALNEIPERLERLESLFSDVQELVLFDKRTKTPVSHRDVGIGISQVLPVLVACFASKEKIVAMEQPEIHLHPALQAELGDVFIQSALGENNNRFLIETHSEHLILRILRRIRETTAGELPPDLLSIKPEDVVVLYVSPDKNGCRVVEIPINPDGEFAAAWPDGFFPERAKELF